MTQPNNRRPVYGEKDSRFRIVSRPNGAWAVQELDEVAKHSQQLNKHDPWHDLMGASRLSWDDAATRLANTQPMGR